MCDTMVSITADGVLFAKNSDRDPNEAQVPGWFPAADHPPGTTLRCTWIDIPQVPHTHGVLLSRPWWMWGAEMGTNEHGVTIGNEAVFTHQPLGDAALLGMDLVRLGLERASTADEAAQVIVSLLETHGQGGSCSHEHPDFSYHNSFLIADCNGALVVETAGKEWATEAVSGAGRSISNGLTIPGFAEAHRDRLRERVAACSRRRAITEAGARRAEGIRDLIDVLSEHGAAPSPKMSILNGGLSAPCAHAGGLLTSTQTTASWVADLRGSPLVWLTATAAPCTSLFVPAHLDGTFPDMGTASNRFDESSRWWRHERLHRLAMRNHRRSLERIAPKLRAVQDEWLQAPPTTSEALMEADSFDSAAITELAAASMTDDRPFWLRRKWQGWNRAAGVDLPG